MKTIRHILISILLGIVAYYIAAAIADWYVDLLKSSGGLVTARDLVGAKFTPFAIAILVCGGYLKITLE